MSGGIFINAARLKIGNFVNFNGRPTTWTATMPENGLATLAGVCRRQGVKPLIRDFATNKTMQALVPWSTSQRLVSILKNVEEITTSQRKNRSITTKDQLRLAKAFLELKYHNANLERIQKKFIHLEAKKIAEETKKQDVGFIGFKLWNGDGFTGSVAMAKEIKRLNPKLKIFFGGPQAKSFREHIYKLAPFVDAIAYGDGELSMEGLIQHTFGNKELSQIPGIIYKQGSKIIMTPLAWETNLNNLPMPDYSEETYPALRDMTSKVHVFVVETNRGCGGKCAFCVIPKTCGEALRLIPPEKVVDQMEHIINTTGFHSFRFAGSTSTTSLLTGIAKEMEKRNVKAMYSSFATVNGVNPAHLEYLAKSGLVSLFFGIESGSDEVLASMNKNLATEKVKRVVAAVKQSGIYAVGSVIYPYLKDSPELRTSLVNLISEVKPDSVPYQFLGVYPQTEMASDPAKFGIEFQHMNPIKKTLQNIGMIKAPSYYSDEMLDYLIKYKLNLLFPPQYWQPLPWKMGGMDYKQIVQASMETFDAIKATGQTMMMTDEEILMAMLARENVNDFYDAGFHTYFSGDHSMAQEMTAMINMGAMNLARAFKGESH